MPEQKKGASSERMENIVAIAVFSVLVIVMLLIFTQGFGLFKPKVERLKVSIGDSPFRGNESAKVVVVAFSDYQCPYCKNAEATIESIYESYQGEVALVFKNFPLTSIHPQAMGAALAAQCANEQGKFWEYHDLLFANNNALDAQDLKSYAKDIGLNTSRFDDCLDSEKYSFKVQSDISQGYSLGVSSTPTFFINGIPLVGSQRASEFDKIISRELKR